MTGIHSVAALKTGDTLLRYQDNCRYEQWEVVAPELVFAPR